VNELVELAQIERIKKFFRKYAMGVGIGILFTIVVSFVWQYKKQTRENNLIRASMQYENMLDAITDQNKLTTETLAKDLLQNYSHTPYAPLAAFQLAKQAIKENKFAIAEDKLMWVVEHGNNDSLRAVARIRLARILLAENQAQRAMQVLDANNNTAYQALILEEKGDVFLHLGRSKEALQNYLAAEKLFSQDLIERPLLSLKIRNLLEPDNA
jgi:predicted negative regulator of RcsB-dependent stress response